MECRPLAEHLQIRLELRHLFERDVMRVVRMHTDDAAKISLEEHRAICEAIAASDGDTAATAMREHIAKAWARRRAPGVA